MKRDSDDAPATLMMMVFASTAIVLADWRYAAAGDRTLVQNDSVRHGRWIRRRGTAAFPSLVDGRADSRPDGIGAARWHNGEASDWSCRGLSRPEIAAVFSGRHWSGRRCLVRDLVLPRITRIAGPLPPTFAQHLLIVPVANMAGAIPATPSGLGTLEAAAEALYQAVPRNPGIAPGDGTLVALAHRVTMIAVAVIGMAYYVSQRSELGDVLTEMETAAEGA